MAIFRSRKDKERENVTLFAAALLVAIGGIIYELILGSAASYLIGDSTLSFSIATGVTLFGMGVGSLLVKKVKGHPATSFALNEIFLSLVGGNSVLILYIAFGFTKISWIVFSIISLLIGVMIGFEIPLMMKTFEKFGRKSSVELLSKVFAIDYFGALVASLVFPLLLLPQLGLMRSAYFVASLNILVSLLILKEIKTSKKVFSLCLGAFFIVASLFVASNWLEKKIDSGIYKDPIVFYKQTEYQKIVLTKYYNDTRLFLNNNLQFSSLDEARYHETLAVSAMSSVENPKRVAIFGGGDGLLAREILKYPSVEHIDLVDIDSEMTKLAKENNFLRSQNEGSFFNKKVKIHNQDAFRFAFETDNKYDVVLVDLVDPSNERLAKLYSKQFYQRVNDLLTDRGVMITQATSSYFSPNAFATVFSTVKEGQRDREVLPFSINIPSFGEWGFIMSIKDKSKVLSQSLPTNLKYQNKDNLDYIIKKNPIKINKGEISTLLQPRIIEIYNNDMKQWRYYK